MCIGMVTSGKYLDHGPLLICIAMGLVRLANLVKMPQSSFNQATDYDYAFSSSVARNGTFISPHYPNPYPGDVTSRYTFNGARRERVQIIFNTLHLNYPDGNAADPFDCEGMDSVSISILIDSMPNNLGIYCGSKQPPMLMSNNNYLEVIFTAITGPTAATGFSANYYFVTDFGIKNGRQVTYMDCGFEFHSAKEPNGTFTSPNFPGLYPRNTECYYLFFGQVDERIHITFAYFDVEGITPGCIADTQSDYVEFSRFNMRHKKSTMHRYCGARSSHHPNPCTKFVISNGNWLRVTFKSNDIYDGTGFEAFYQFRNYADPHRKLNADSRIMTSNAALTRTAPNSTAILVCLFISPLVITMMCLTSNLRINQY